MYTTIVFWTFVSSEYFFGCQPCWNHWWLLHCVDPGTSQCTGWERAVFTTSSPISQSSLSIIVPNTSANDSFRAPASPWYSRVGRILNYPCVISACMTCNIQAPCQWLEGTISVAIKHGSTISKGIAQAWAVFIGNVDKGNDISSAAIDRITRKWFLNNRKPFRHCNEPKHLFCWTSCCCCW